jgi:hypothetical protein
MVSAQLPVPEQAPLQPLKVKYGLGLAVSVAGCPGLNVIRQVPGQLIPLPAALPPPVTVTRSVGGAVVGDVVLGGVVVGDVGVGSAVVGDAVVGDVVVGEVVVTKVVGVTPPVHRPTLRQIGGPHISELSRVRRTTITTEIATSVLGRPSLSPLLRPAVMA